MSHANAALTPRARLRLAQLVLDRGWSYAAAAKMFMVAPRTAKKWTDRYRAEGAAGMVDRSSRPKTCPTRTRPEVVRQIVRLRWRQRLGPVQIAGRLGMQASTVHAVLVRCRINRLSHIDRVTGEPLRRYEHPHPGSLIHVDVTKFGNIPDGGGWRYVGKQQGRKNRSVTSHRTGTWSADRHARTGVAFLHTVIDDHSRVAYAEICTDEQAATAIGVLRRAVAWFAERGVNVERVLSDNGAAYRSHAWRDACTELSILHKRTRPYRPQTNGKIERFHRTLADGWAYARFYESTEQRNAALPGWLHFYNHHRAHSAIGGRPPVTRLTNLPGHHSYGSEIATVLEAVDADPALGEPLACAPGYLAAEVAFAVTHEGALHLEDVLTRRVRLSMESRDRGAAALEEIADVVAPLLGWDGTRRQAEIDAYRQAAEAEAAAETERTDDAAQEARLAAEELVPVRPLNRKDNE